MAGRERESRSTDGKVGRLVAGQSGGRVGGQAVDGGGWQAAMSRLVAWLAGRQ